VDAIFYLEAKEGDTLSQTRPENDTSGFLLFDLAVFSAGYVFCVA
jgi:hypothetical protein